nr:hypothetical protein [uncultured archaeon]
MTKDSEIPLKSEKERYDKVDPEEIIEKLKKIIEKIKLLKEEQRKHEEELPYTYSD